MVPSLSPQHLLTFAAEVTTPGSSPTPSHCSCTWARLLILCRCALSARNSRSSRMRASSKVSARCCITARDRGAIFRHARSFASAQCYHNCSTFFHCKEQPLICCIQHCLDQLTVCELTCRTGSDELQERTLNTAARFVNAVDSVQV